jgi:hypothetical protein
LAEFAFIKQVDTGLLKIIGGLPVSIELSLELHDGQSPAPLLLVTFTGSFAAYYYSATSQSPVELVAGSQDFDGCFWPSKAEVAL